MSIRYLGPSFDIHTGGVDHVAVHHTNEIAQSECAFDVHPWVRFWLHCDFLIFERGKMAKSTGHVLLLDDLLRRGYDPLAYRYFFLQAHYRQQQAWSDAAMEAADVGYRRLLGHAAEVREAGGEADPERVGRLRQRFRQAIRDDLNAPRALAVVWEVARQPGLSAADRRGLLHEFDAVLGLGLVGARRPEEVQEFDPRIEALLARREQARSQRDFAESDRIRDALAAEGILVEDTPGGPRWRRTR